jgi:uncharacterized phage protein gp47/JayE
VAAPSFQDLFDLGKAEAQNRRPELSFNEGDISEMVVVAATAMADAVIGYAARRFRATYLDGASGDDLTALADDHFNVQREPAVKSSGTETFTRPSAAAGAGTIPAGTVIATTKDAFGNEVRFVVRADIVVGVSALTVSGTVDAELAGVLGNVAAAAVNRVVSALFDTTFTCTNAAQMAGGADEESDDSLRDRVRTVPLTYRRATLAALEYGAKTVAGVATSTAAEDGTGLVTLYVADSSGGSNPTMTANVTTEIENWRAAGVSVNVVGATLDTLVIALMLTVRLGVDIPSLVVNIKAAIVARLNKLKVGESCSPTLIKQAAMNVDPDGILDVTVTTPSVTVVPTSGHVIRTNAGSITVS